MHMATISYTKKSRDRNIIVQGSLLRNISTQVHIDTYPYGCLLIELYSGKIVSTSDVLAVMHRPCLKMTNIRSVPKL